MLRLYNTLSRQLEEFKPLNPPKVGLYSCGPTVYDYPHIGNWRTFVFDDLLRRVLEFNGYNVIQVMNATDVGHLTGDNMGDADLGEDRMEKAAKRENKTAWDIANFYIADFKDSWKLLNIQPPTHFVRATDHIQEQIDLIKRLETNGLTYVTKLGVYFNVAKFPEYGKLGGQKLVDKRTAARDELKEDPEKKNAFDFALWKFSPPGEKRQMEWESPWGVGFPGWHIECSAMSMKYLGESFDIHTGGVDHIAIHHTNEIAQSEGATGKPFAKYWLHGEFLTVDGGRMGKSLGNAYNLHDIIDKGFDPLALRYFYFSAHYRTKLNFSWDNLENAQNSLVKLRNKTNSISANKSTKANKEYHQKFSKALDNDLNMPEALAVLWKLLDDTQILDDEKFATILAYDRVLGLELDKLSAILTIPDSVEKLVQERQLARDEKRFADSDKIRQQIEKLGFVLEDTASGPKITKK